MTMRVYALYEKSRCIIATLSAVIAGVLGFSIPLDTSGPSSLILPERVILGSFAMLTKSHEAIVWAAQVIFDIVIFVLTVWKSYCIGKVGNRLLLDVLLRDGAMYFAIISGVNAANIAVLLLASAPYKPVAGTFPNALNVVLVSRLVLNLQEPSRQGISVDSQSAEDEAVTMTTVIPLGDAPLSMRIDDADLWLSQRGSGTLGMSDGGERRTLSV
ncbi:hypothetical protein V8E55_007266 [Tylopilus felleus]